MDLPPALAGWQRSQTGREGETHSLPELGKALGRVLGWVQSSPFPFPGWLKAAGSWLFPPRLELPLLGEAAGHKSHASTCVPAERRGEAKAGK